MPRLTPRNPWESAGAASAILGLLIVALGLLDVFVSWQSPIGSVPMMGFTALGIGVVALVVGLLMLIAGKLHRLTELHELLIEHLS